MNRKNYLSELEKHLKSIRVEDVDEVLAEYGEHFDRKLSDGFTEEEIAAKLGSPSEIARQFADSQKAAQSKKTSKLPLTVGLGFLDLWEGLLLVALFSVVAALAVAGIGLAVSGLLLIVAPSFLQSNYYFPVMPYFGQFLAGLSLIPLGVLFGAVALYGFRLAVKVNKSFFRWQKSVYRGGKYASFPIFPLLETHWHRKLRKILLISSLACVFFFVGAFAVLSINAGTLGFWHALGWFVS